MTFPVVCVRVCVNIRATGLFEVHCSALHRPDEAMRRFAVRERAREECGRRQIVKGSSVGKGGK